MAEFFGSYEQVARIFVDVLEDGGVLKRAASMAMVMTGRTPYSSASSVKAMMSALLANSKLLCVTAFMTFMKAVSAWISCMIVWFVLCTIPGLFRMSAQQYEEVEEVTYTCLLNQSP